MEITEFPLMIGAAHSMGIGATPEPAAVNYVAALRGDVARTSRATLDAVRRAVSRALDCEAPRADRHDVEKTVLLYVPSARARRAVLALAVASFAAFGAFFAYTVVGFGGPRADSIFNNYVYSAIEVAAFVLCLLRVAYVPADRLAWGLLTAAVGSWTLADLLFSFAYANDPPFPSIADVFYLAFYPLCYVGLLLLVRAHVADFNRSLWLDGLTAALGSAALGAAVLVQVVLESTEGPPSTVITNIAYPIGDVLLLSLVIGVFALSGWRPGSTWLYVGLGFGCSAIADAAFLFQSAAGTYAPGNGLRRVLAGRAPSDRLVRLAGATGERESARGEAMARNAGRRRLDRHRRPRLRPFPPAELARALALRAHAARGHGARGPDVPRERPHARAHPPAGDHRSTDAARKQAEPRHGPRPCARGCRRGHRADPHHLRPQRLQALQRHLRPPVGRPAASPAERSARRSRQAARRRIPARWGRVLRARRRARRRARGAPRRDDGGADGGERGLHRDDVPRRGLPTGRGSDGERGPTARRPPALRAQARGGVPPQPSARGAAPGDLRARAEPAAIIAGPWPSCPSTSAGAWA